MAIRRIPLALTFGLAIQAMQLVVGLLSFDLARHPRIGFELLAADLVSNALMVVGLIQLAACSARPVRIGAVIAAIGAAVGVAMVFVSSIMRPHLEFAWISFAVGVVIAVGFATMSARRSWPLAAAMLAVVVAGYLMPPDAGGDHALHGFVFIALAFVIAARVSPDAPPRAADPTRTVAIASLVLFAISLFMPAVVIKDFSFDDAKPERILGITCLLYGWLLWLGWAANPILLIGALLYALRRPRAAFVCGCFALVSAGIAPFLLFHDDSVGMQTLQIGYWLWVASIVTFIVASYARARPRAPRFPGAFADPPPGT